MTDDDISEAKLAVLEVSCGIKALPELEFYQRLEGLYWSGFEAGIEKTQSLYVAVNEMMAALGAHGEISARDDRVQAVMDALYEIDGGVPKMETRNG